MSSINNKILAYYYGFNEKPMEIRKKCETKFYLKKKEDKNSIFDIGAYGTVDEVCLKTDCKYIVKMIPLTHERVYRTFLREALIAPMMAKIGVGPKIHEIFMCLNSGYIIMERWDSSIRRLITTNKFEEKNLKKVMDIIAKMHNKGVIHNDLHTGNILYKINEKGEYEFCITDYGLSLYFENKTDVIPNEFVPVNGPNIFYPAFDYHRFNGALEARSDIIFIPYFFSNGYLTLIDYLLVNKYYYKQKTDPTTFSEFLESINLNKNKIKKMSQLNSNSNFLENSPGLKQISMSSSKNKSYSVKKELFNKTKVSLHESNKKI